MKSAKRLYFIDNSVPQYKTELHLHTDCSDGVNSPEEVKKLYKSFGYSVVAFTDHDVFVRHNELTDEEFIALNGYELNLAPFSADEKNFCKQVHLNFIATSPDTDEMLFYNPAFIFQKGAKRFIGKIKCSEPPEYRANTPEWINKAIRRAEEKGFLVTYNHPVWSLVAPEDYLNIDGLFAMEVWNTGGILSTEEDGAAYREMIRHGKKLYCVASNDFHNIDECGGALPAAVYVCTDDFSYGGIIGALKNGKFYSSCGPTIEELSVENGKLRVKCSPVKSVRIIGGENVRAAYSENGDLTEAEFILRPSHRKVFYVLLTDKDGNKAWSNPVWNYPALGLEENVSKLFVCDGYTRYDLPDGLSNVCFSEQFISEQTEEIFNYCNKYDLKELFIQFSVSEIIGFDHCYDNAQNVERKQSERLGKIKPALEKLGRFLKEKGIKTTVFSYPAMEHGADIPDYRNSEARQINIMLKQAADLFGWEYVDIFGELVDGKTGKLKAEYRDFAVSPVNEYFAKKK